MGRDYYRILDVPKDVTQDQLKKAYRKMAIKWHPDKHQDPAKKAEAEEMFKDVAEAYDVLSDPEKRSVYDLYGEDGLKGGRPPGPNGANVSYTRVYSGVDASDLFSHFFGHGSLFDDDDLLGGSFFSARTSTITTDNPFSTHHSIKKTSKAYTSYLNVTLEELYKGTKKRMRITRTRWNKGRMYQDEKILDVQVKPGWKDGTKITFKNEGDQESPEHSIGDVIFVITTIAHSRFTRNGNHLVYRHKITLRECFVGTTIRIETLDGRNLNLSCSPIITPQTRRIIANEGMPCQKTGTRGDIIVEFDIHFPTDLSMAQQSAIVAILDRKK